MSIVVVVEQIPSLVERVRFEAPIHKRWSVIILAFGPRLPYSSWLSTLSSFALIPPLIPFSHLYAHTPHLEFSHDIYLTKMPRKDPLQEMLRTRDEANDALAHFALSGPPLDNNSRGKEKQDEVNVAKAVVLSAFDLTFMLSLVLGGCCSYVAQMHHRS